MRLSLRQLISGICIGCILLPVAVYGQLNTSNLIPPSPEAAELWKYTQIPVSLYTGIPDIKIPFFQLSEREVNVPISLTYHARGNRVTDAATRVGVGWNLSVGGAISRVAVGLPDEHPNGFLDFSTRYTYQSMSEGTEAQKYGLYQRLSQRCEDSEPDLFSFNINGLSGTFSFDWSRNIVISSSENVLLTYNRSAGGEITSWQLTDANGIRYVFDVLESTSFAGCATDLVNCTTSWYVSKIFTPNNVQLFSFNYVTYQQSNPSVSESVTYFTGEVPNCSAQESIVWNHATSNNPINGVYLSGIVTASGQRAVFIGQNVRSDIAGTNTNSLDTVKLFSSNGQLVKHLALNYDYSTGRLTLKSVKEFGNTVNIFSPPYEFYYNAIPIPGVLSSKQDHWGFPNNNQKIFKPIANSDYESLVPSGFLNHPTGYYQGADRSPDAEQMQAGMLTKIIYPSGQSSMFEFEPHDYSETGIAERPRTEEIYLQNLDGRTELSETRTFAIDPYGTGPTNPVKVSIEYMAMNVNRGIIPAGSYIELKKDASIVFSKTAPASATEVLLLAPGNYTLLVRIRSSQSQDQIRTKLSWVEGATASATVLTKISGGLRIKKITDSAGLISPNSIVKRFIYRKSDNSSSGVAVNTGVKYDYVMDYFQNENCFNAYGNKQITRVAQVRVASNLYVNSLTQGSTVGYSEVTTLYGEEGEGGKNISRFTTANDARDIFSPAIPAQPFAPPTTYEFRRGLLTSSLEFKKEDNTYQLVQQVNYTYTEGGSVSSVPVTKVGIKIGGEPKMRWDDRYGWLTDGTFNARYAFASYNRVFGSSKPQVVIDTIYYGNLKTVNTSTTQYSNDLTQVRSNSKTVSLGKSLLTQYYYPTDYTNVHSDSAIARMRALHILNPVIEQVTSEVDAAGGSKVIAGSYMEYQALNPSKTLIMPFKSYRFVSNTPQLNLPRSATQLNGRPSSEFYAEETRFTRYDTATGKVLEIKTVASEAESYVWGYKGTLPIAKTINASYSLTAFTDFENDTIGGNWLYRPTTSSPATAFFATESKTGERAFKSDIQSNLLPRGIYKVSMWAKAATGNLSITVQDVRKPITNEWKLYEWTVSLNAESQIIVTGNGNLIDAVRLYPLGAQMTTYSYKPLLGMTHSVDVNNRVTSYEYDGLGRLVIVRDQNGDILKHYRYRYARQ